MRYLLDTHTFLWFIMGDPALPAGVRTIIEAPTTMRFLSVGSLWEMAIKINAGKLAIGMPFTVLVQQHVVGNGMRIMDIAAEHLAVLTHLPFYHKDPFDRLLIAQAIHEAMPILGRDSAFDAYAVQRHWG